MIEGRKNTGKTGVSIKKIKLIFLPFVRNFCGAATQGKRLCFAAIATSFTQCNLFSFCNRKNRKTHPGVVTVFEIKIKVF